MPSKRWLWVRPTPRVYAYNREMSTFNTTPAPEDSASYSLRSLRASSEAAVERSTSSRAVRAASAAPEPGSGLAGYNGYYDRQLKLLKEAEMARQASSSSVKAASSSVKAASSASAMSKSTAATSVKKTVERQETSVQQETLQQKKVSFMKRQEASLQEGRQSMSKAVRRAEYHAQTSGKDPRHVGVPRDLSDDILKKMADIHICPYEGREIGEARAAASQGKLRVERMDKELASITASAMKYKSLYSKSAAEMAKEALQAVEAESKSFKKTRKTVVEETRRQVAAA